MWYLLIFLWCFVGITIIIHDWIQEFDLKINDIPILLGYGITIGPFIGCSLFFRYFIASKYQNKILINRKLHNK